VVGALVGTYYSSVIRSNQRKVDPRDVKALLQRARAKDERQPIDQRVRAADEDWDDTAAGPTEEVVGRQPRRRHLVWIVALGASACLVVMCAGNFVVASILQLWNPQSQAPPVAAQGGAGKEEDKARALKEWPPSNQLPEKGQVQYLVDLQELDVQSGPWKFSKGGTGADGKTPIRVDGTLSSRGLGMHPPNQGYAAAKYQLDGKALQFKSAMALNDSASPLVSTVIFEVLGDGKSLWKSAAIGKKGQVQECVVDVSGVQVLELRVISTGAYMGLHAVWLEPRLVLA